MSGRGVRSTGPSSTESPFASSGRYPSEGDVVRLLGPHYQAIVAHTGSGAEPRSSLRLHLTAGWRVLAGCCESLLEMGPSRRLPLRLFPHVLGPLPRLPSWCTCSFLPTRLRPSLRYDQVGGWHLSHEAATSTWGSLRGCRHSFTFRPAGLLATLIAPTHAQTTLCLAAVAFTSEQNTICYLLVHRLY